MKAKGPPLEGLRVANGHRNTLCVLRVLCVSARTFIGRLEGRFAAKVVGLRLCNLLSFGCRTSLTFHDDHKFPFPSLLLKSLVQLGGGPPKDLFVRQRQIEGHADPA